MGERIVILNGFEEGLASVLAENFQFDMEKVWKEPLVLGRHLFVESIPEVTDVKTTTPSFDMLKEPMLAIYNSGGASVVPTISSGSKMEYNLRVVIRFGVVFETAKILLEQVVSWIDKNIRGRRVGRHRVKGAFIVSRPSPFQRVSDAQAYCSATLRFLAVPVS